MKYLKGAAWVALAITVTWAHLIWECLTYREVKNGR